MANTDDVIGSDRSSPLGDGNERSCGVLLNHAGQQCSPENAEIPD
jgi:hypothetical protein